MRKPLDVDAMVKLDWNVQPFPDRAVCVLIAEVRYLRAQLAEADAAATRVRELCEGARARDEILYASTAGRYPEYVFVRTDRVLRALGGGK